MSEHHCHAWGCSVSTSPEMLMCRRHWFMVPKSLRDRVWAAYRSGQCEDKRPSDEWHRAADEAIKSVYTKERELELARKERREKP